MYTPPSEELDQMWVNYTENISVRSQLLKRSVNYKYIYMLKQSIMTRMTMTRTTKMMIMPDVAKQGISDALEKLWPDAFPDTFNKPCGS